MQRNLSNIDSFIDTMIDILPKDILIYLLTKYVYKDRNLQIIRKQKQNKIILNMQFFDIFNMYYNDTNFKLYRNKNDQYVLHNKLKNKQLYIYTPNQEIIPVTNTNELILFDNQHVNRQIKLYIVYL